MMSFCRFQESGTGSKGRRFLTSAVLWKPWIGWRRRNMYKGGAVKTENKSDVIKILACLAVILPVILTAYYNRPCADDYAYTFMTHEALQQGAGIPGLLKAALETDIYYYNSWQGLYTSAFVMALTPSVYGEKYYRWCTCMILAAMFLAVYFCVRMAGRGISRQTSLLSAGFICTYFVLCMPSGTQGLFWYNGAVNYIPFTMLTVFNIVLIGSLYFRNRDAAYFVLHIVAAVCSFVISGGNHVSAFANILMTAMLVPCFIHRRRFCAVLPLMSAAAGFCFMYLAPGTAVRQAVLTKSSVWKTIWMSGLHTVDTVCSWVDLNYIVFLLICIPFVHYFTRHVVYQVRKRDFLLVLCAMFVTLSGMFSAPYYAESDFGAGRLVNAVWIVFTFFSLAGLAAAVIYIRQHGYFCCSLPRNAGNRIWNLLFIPACFVLFWNPGFSGTAIGRTCAEDLWKGRAKAYAEEMDARIESFQNPDVKEIQVRPLSEKAVSSILFFSDLSTDPAGFPNAFITMYYDKIATLAQ